MTNQEIVALYEKGWSKKKIRRECKLTLKKVEDAIRHIPGAIKIPEESLCNRIISDYQNGMRFESVRKKYKIHGTTLNNIFLHYGIEKVRKRKRNIDKDFFEVIDSEEKAYWLGFLFADGYNEERRGYIEVSLAFYDVDHLEKFKRAISSEHPIAQRKIGNSFASRLNFCSRKMSNDLAQLGCVQAKSLILEFPQNIPDDLIHHFIRGYFDGDGSVVVNKENGTYHFHLLGTESFVESVRAHIGLSDTLLGEKGQSFDLRYGGRLNLLKIYDYLYKDATIFLERKHDRFLLCQ